MKNSGMQFPQVSWRGLYQATPMAVANKSKYAGNVFIVLAICMLSLVAIGED